jgi:TonB family protein
VKAIAVPFLALVLAGLLQAVSSPVQAVNPSAQEPLKIDPVAGFIHLLSKPELAYPKDALQKHIEGKVELEVTVSPQGDVLSERAVWGPPVLQQAAMDAFKKAKYIPFLRDGKPSVALVRVIVAYEKDQATIGTEGEHEIIQLAPPAIEYKKYASSVSAGTAIQEATATSGSGDQGNGGDFGSGKGAHGQQMGNLEILSDTKGVDFSAYLQAVLRHVRENWYKAIPESARWKHGNLAIEFAITKDGKVAGMKLVTTSGDVWLDRAAWGGIVGSAPFPALPSEFSGSYLALRFKFFYNPTEEELSPADSATPAPASK